jgi:hypothetical protein
MLPRPQKQIWKAGDVFVIPNADGKFSIGQVLAHETRTLHSAACAFFDQRAESIEAAREHTLDAEKCFSALLVTSDSLTKGIWRVVGQQPIILAKKHWPYETLLSKGTKVGTVVHGSGIVTKFIDAFYRLSPWDEWYRPDYLDAFLLSPEKKPKDLIFSKQ